MELKDQRYDVQGKLVLFWLTVENKKVLSKISGEICDEKFGESRMKCHQDHFRAEFDTEKL